MALSRAPLSYAVANPAVVGTSVAPNNPVPDNCTHIYLLNESATVDVLFGVGAPGGALVEGTSGSRLKAGSAIVLAVGSVVERGIMDQSQVAGSGLVFDTTGAAVQVGITYRNKLGPLL